MADRKQLALGVAAGVAAGALAVYVYQRSCCGTSTCSCGASCKCCSSSSSECSKPTASASAGHSAASHELSFSVAPKAEAEKSGAIFSDPNDPRDEHGRVHHLHVGNGDVASRVLSVGDAGRAERISKLFDQDAPVNKITSSRGFITYTGKFKGVPVSVIATGMGLGQADFVVRECRAVIDGPMAIMRFGTCGGLNNTPTGSIVVASEGSVYVMRQPDLFREGSSSSSSSSSAGGATSGAGATAAAVSSGPSVSCPYHISAPILPDAKLSSQLFDTMSTGIAKAFGEGRFPVLKGMDATADSFYGSQGRQTRFFDDRNTELIARLESDERLKSLRTLQMETALFYDLAQTTKADYPMFASACAMVLANRHGNAVLSKAELVALESVGGRACLEALVSFDLDSKKKA